MGTHMRIFLLAFGWLTLAVITTLTLLNFAGYMQIGNIGAVILAYIVSIGAIFEGYSLKTKDTLNAKDASQ
jgi:hypothetical protein